jgi:hypothetical protein
MERSFFVVAFGVCLILAQDDQPQKLSQALSQGAVMQEPPKDIGETLFADVSDILGKHGDIIPLNQENGFPLPAISIAFDMGKKNGFVHSSGSKRSRFSSIIRHLRLCGHPRVSSRRSRDVATVHRVGSLCR